MSPLHHTVLLHTRLICLFFLSSGATKLKSPIDLSWPYDETARQCPGSQDFEFLKQIVIDDPVWYALNTFAVAEHCGTHIDAPYHFNPNGDTLEKIPISKLLVTCVFIDASHETGDNVNYTLPQSKVKKWEKANGPIPENSVVLVKFGWASRYNDKEKYIGGVEGNGARHPGISPEATQYLIDSGKVVGVGVDCSSADPGYDSLFTSHVKLNTAGLYILENVAVTTRLPPLFKLIVAPMKIGRGTGGPTRLFALPLDYKF